MKLLSTGGLARASALRPRLVIGLWLLAIVISVVLINVLLGNALTTDFAFTNTPEAQKATNLLEDLRGHPRSTNEVIIIKSDTLTVDDPIFKKTVLGIYNDLKEMGHAVIREGTLTNYYQNGNEVLVSQDRRSTIIPLIMGGNYDDATDNIGQVIDVVEATVGPTGLKVLITGQATIAQDSKEISQEDLETGEKFGVSIALIILVLVFGALVAALVPILLAIASIIIALGVASVIGQGFQLSFFVTNIIFMIGLAVGVDYSLFIVARYREERSRNLGKLDAIGRTGETATRTVLFSGIAVVLGLIGMLFVPFNVFIALGLGAILVVVSSVLAAMTLLPAMLSILGDNVNRLSIPWIKNVQVRSDTSTHSGFWGQVSRRVMHQPLISLLLAGSLLTAATIPLVDLHIGFAGVSTFPDDTRSKQGFVVLDEKFSAGNVTPAYIVINGDINSHTIQNKIRYLRTLLASDAAFGRPVTLEVSATGDIANLSVPVTGDSATEKAKNAITKLRAQYVPDAFRDSQAKVYVGGETAYTMDFFDSTKDAAWVVFPFVLGVSFLLLMLVFRSIIVPIKAIILNLLAVAATYGLLVLVFQKGFLADALGFQKSPIIEAWLPLFLFAILFGLSMDYHVFLLSRIRERFDQTHNNTESIVFGIRSTGRLITGAAFIMIAVFWAFSAGSLVGLQQMGFGLGTAILLDATVVRMILVPASMKLLGKWNWYLPDWLRWIPDLRVEVSDYNRP